MTTYKIGDLVRVDEQAAFRNDVQLDNFDAPTLNLGLVESYLFSTALPGGGRLTQQRELAPAGVLEKLVQTFNNNRLENRLCLIATYGHGKSHLALALANYFGRPTGSPEITTLLQKLANALGNPAEAAGYTDFKKARGEFLVLRLRGDLPHDLQEQVLSGLEKALNEHHQTRGQKLPFWFSEAEQILNAFTPAEQEKANNYLRAKSQDLPLLKQRLNKREDVYDLCIQLIQHIKGVRPNLGRQISLAEVIRWATDNFCGSGKPLGGVLVLFDEFGLYVQRYAKGGAVGELQDLLNGISDRPGQAAFLVFSQLDLMSLADNLAISGETKISLKRELTRIPQTYTLFSLMESVVAAYLTQEARHWNSFLQDKSINGPFYQATDVAWGQFQKRYRTQLLWTHQHFQEKISKGAFPLHPITTYLLCNLRLQSGDASVPRTVLGFVLAELRNRQEEPAILGKRPNWILPINLVDYFGERLSGEVYSQYNTAKLTIGNDAPEAQQALLKALLLQNLAEITPRHDDQIAYLAQSAGLDEREAKQALRILSDNNVIRYDHTYKSYAFWPTTTHPKRLEETIQKKLDSFAWTTHTLDELNETLADLPENPFGKIDIPVSFGHQTDWAAREQLVTADLLTTEWLKNRLPSLLYHPQNLQEVARSLIVWVVARRDDERDELGKKIQDVIQEGLAVYGATPPVVVFITPTKTCPELFDAYLRYYALRNFTQKERSDAGQDMYESAFKTSQLELYKALKEVRGDNFVERQRSKHLYIVPSVYGATARNKEQFTIRSLLEALYLAAFSFAPEFFTQYQITSRGSTKLKDATRKTAQVLFDNASNDLQTLARSEAMIRDLINKFLVPKWGLLRDDYRIQEQPAYRIREAWQYIDKAIKPGQNETKLRDVLFPLLNPPYGYDYNTATLLFAAWFGYHRLDLEVSINGQRVAKSNLVELLEKGPKDFFSAIASTKVVSIQRKIVPDKTEIRQQIELAREKSFSITEAHNEIIALKEIGGNERYDVDLRRSASEAAKFLEDGQQQALRYDREAGQLKQQIEQANSAENLIELQKKLNALPNLGNVQAKQDDPATIGEQYKQRLVAVVEKTCRENEAPKQLTEVGLNWENLKRTQKAISLAGLSALSERLKQSFQRLKEREVQLNKAFQEDQRVENLRKEIRGVDPAGSLQHLLLGIKTLQELDNLTDELSQLRDSHLKEVKQAIASIDQQLAECRERLVNSTQVADVRPVRDRLLQLQTRCLNTDKTIEIDQLLAQAETIRETLVDQEKRHGELKQTIVSITDQAPLHSLLQGRSRLIELVDLPPDLGQLRDNRVKSVDKAIADIRNQIKQVKTRLETTQALAELNKIRDIFYTLKSRCGETPEAVELESLITMVGVKQDELVQAQQRSDAIRQIIDSADPGTSLKGLLKSEQQLMNLGNVPAGLHQTHQQKLTAIQQAIQAIRSQIAQTRSQLETVTERTALNKIENTLLRLQIRCAEQPEEQAINQLITKTNQRKATLEAEERRYNEWRAIINGVNTKQQQLSLLIEGQKTLESLPALPDGLNLIRNNRLQEIKSAIATLKQQIEQVEQSLNTVTDPNQLQKQRDMLIDLKQRCQNTVLESVIAGYIERADALRTFFEQLEGERKPQVDSPEVYQEQMRRLEQLGQAVSLSLNQRGLLTKKQNEVKKAAQNQQEQARLWLAKQEAISRNNGSLTDLAKQLDNPPQNVILFLSPAELHHLDQLRQQVQQQIDANTITAIESRFRQIRDRHLQEQCLQMLQQIYEATQ